MRCVFDCLYSVIPKRRTMILPSCTIRQGNISVANFYSHISVTFYHSSGFVYIIINASLQSQWRVFLLPIRRKNKVLWPIFSNLTFTSTKKTSPSEIVISVSEDWVYWHLCWLSPELLKPLLRWSIMQTFTLTFTKGCKNVPHSCFKSDYWVGRRYIVLSLFGHSGTRFDSAVQRLTQLVNIWARVHGRVFTLGFVFASVLYHNGSVCDSFYVCFVNIVIKAYERLLRGFLMYLQHGKKNPK